LCRSCYGTNRDGLEDEHNITDERGYYFQETGFLRAAGHGVDNFSESIRGRKVRAQGRSVMMAGNVGFFGFYAGPDVHIVDGFALADPLLARLPVRSVRWRIGHFIRTIPDGYLQTLARRKNMIKDARLATYYDRLGFIIRGDLFSVKRLGEVVDMNLGRYDARLEPFFKAREHQVEGFKALERKDTSTALIHLQQSVALDSTRAAAWYGLYLAHRESGDLARAQGTIEKTIALEPEKYGKELINLAVTI
jgi:tetratricopeptide (TPR) repeat protein